MDRLAAAQNLQTNPELISNNGWFRLKIFPQWSTRNIQNAGEPYNLARF
jgi:hypothetical protein